MTRKYLLFGLVGVGIVFYWARGVMFLDPDFGWHIRMGQLILSKGIPMTDPFSYTMPSYPFVDHEWLVNILLARLFSLVDYIGLGVVFTFIAFAALFLQWRYVINLRSKFTRLRKESLQFVFIPFFLAVAILNNFFGIRSQVLSWFFFSLMLFVIRDLKNFRRWRLWLPVVFLLWVNLHGSFAIGIVVLFLASCYRIFRKELRLLDGCVVFLACVGATFITPYGWRVWWEVWMQITDGMLRWSIAEWTPAFLSVNFPFWTLSILSVFLIVRYRKRYTLFDLFLFFSLLLLALSSIRHIPLWVLTSLPLIVQGLIFLSQEAGGLKYGRANFLKAQKVFLVIVFILCTPNFLYILSVFSPADGYPVDAISYLQAHAPRGQIFSAYQWGGYLIWKLPEKKVFIDGRMPSWRREESIPGESDYAYNDYLKFIGGELSFDSVIDKYKISTLLFPNEIYTDEDSFMKVFDDYEDDAGKRFNIPLLRKKMKNFSTVVASAKKAGWVEVYKDKTAVIYQDEVYEGVID